MALNLTKLYLGTVANDGTGSLGRSGGQIINDALTAIEAESQVVDAALAGKSAVGHSHVIGDTTGLQTILEAKADLVGGVVPTSQLPALAITEFLGTSASQAAMLLLVGQKGDWTIRSDLGTVWVIVGNDPTLLADWQEFEYPASPVTSVNDQVGVVVLGSADVGAATAAQGVLADTALQPADVGTAAAEDVGAFATAAQGAKVDFLTVTQPVDLDTIETRVNALDAAVVLKGVWDPSAGTFPGGGTAQAGDSYIVSVGGTVDSVVFGVNDRIIAILDNASTTVFAANWFKADYTDEVLSVAGLVGAISAANLRTAINVEDGATADQSDTEIKTAYQTAVPLISQLDAEAGIATAIESWSALRVAQAIAALGGGGGDFLADGTVDMTGEFGTDVGTFRSDVADSASAVGFSHATSVAFTVAGSILQEWKNSTTRKAYINKDGAPTFNADTVDPVTITGGGYEALCVTTYGWQFRTSSDANGFLKVVGNTASETYTELKRDGFIFGRDTAAPYIKQNTQAVDVATKALTISGQNVAAASTSNLVGGSVTIAGGNGASGSAGAAHGGNLVLDGGTGYGTGHKGYIIMAGLPTSDPGVSGALYVSAGALMVSA